MLNNIKKYKIIGIIGEDRKELCNTLKKENKITDVNITKSLKELKLLDEEELSELLKQVGLNIDVLDRKKNNLSESDILKINFAYELYLDKDIFVLNDTLDIFDKKNKTKFFKILLKLKKYNKKTIFISSSDINNIFQIVDDIIYIDKENYYYDNKYDIFNNKNINQIPDIIYFVSLVKKKHPSVSYKDEVNELIKELYRELR